MNKPLSGLSLEELWQLFPIILTEHKECWDDWYKIEEQRIAGFLQNADYRISHIGSTSIKGIWAKPTVDILLEIPKTSSMSDVSVTLTQNGYNLMCESENRMSFNMGYTESGFAEKVFHLHLRYYGDNDELYFRDYLRDNADVASEYEALKLSLWKKYEHNRDAYTNAKTDFIVKYTQIAKQKYGTVKK